MTGDRPARYKIRVEFDDGETRFTFNGWCDTVEEGRKLRPAMSAQTRFTFNGFEGDLVPHEERMPMNPDGEA
jgi:hypothetical protein